MTINKFEETFYEYLYIMETVPMLPFMESPLEGWFVDLETVFAKYNVIHTKLKCWLLQKFLDRVLEKSEKKILNQTLAAVGEKPFLKHKKYETLKDHLLILWPDTYKETAEEMKIFLHMVQHYSN